VTGTPERVTGTPERVTGTPERVTGTPERVTRIYPREMIARHCNCGRSPWIPHGLKSGYPADKNGRYFTITHVKRHEHRISTANHFRFVETP